MDIFNKKKIAALQKDLTLASAKLEATTTELADLKDSLVTNYAELTQYFKPKYINKYFKCDGMTIRFQVQSVLYQAGTLYFTALINDFVGKPFQSKLEFTIPMLKKLKVITKDGFYGNTPKKTDVVKPAKKTTKQTTKKGDDK